MNILITICARGGSKGIPGKNIKEIGGKPLIYYTIELARNFQEKFNCNIILSTDDLKIKEVSKKIGLSSDYFRPDFLATDTAGKIDAINHVLLYEESKSKKRFDYILDLDVTSPLRTFEDLESAFNLLIENPEALNLFSVNIASRNPYFNMVEKKDNGFFSLVKGNEDGTALTRQSAPIVYELNASFYWYRRLFFDLNLKSTITNKSLVFEMNHICFDLDHPIDFLFMEYLIQNGKLGFHL
uniref:acylneuraminate cytidylyltransferase family protein n=1 Tax=Algoriphagus sp. TaxID=1872435 RepID=UPI00404827EB